MKTAVNMNDPRIGRLALAVVLPAVAGLAALIGLTSQGYLLIPLLLLLPLWMGFAGVSVAAAAILAAVLGGFVGWREWRAILPSDAPDRLVGQSTLHP